MNENSRTNSKEWWIDTFTKLGVQNEEFKENMAELQILMSETFPKNTYSGLVHVAFLTQILLTYAGDDKDITSDKITELTSELLMLFIDGINAGPPEGM